MVPVMSIFRAVSIVPTLALSHRWEASWILGKTVIAKRAVTAMVVALIRLALAACLRQAAQTAER